jgi:hypothetical protein
MRLNLVGTSTLIIEEAVRGLPPSIILLLLLVSEVSRMRRVRALAIGKLKQLQLKLIQG